jgi:hypothetical protein
MHSKNLLHGAGVKIGNKSSQKLLLSKSEKSTIPKTFQQPLKYPRFN